MEVKHIRFYQDPDTRWYVDLPEFPGTKAELEMVLGADTMLDFMSEGTGEVNLSLSEESIDGWDELSLKRLTPDVGGGEYTLKNYRGIELNLDMWLCDVTRYVYNGYMPEKLYISKQ